MNIAVVEDQEKERKNFIEILNRYAREYQEVFHICEFSDALDFLNETRQDFQIVFMDIQMPFMDGMKAARRFRERDSEAVLIFITAMAQYALHGYEVNALDYIVKPLNYYSFSLKMKRAVGQVRLKENQPFLIRRKDGVIKISLRNIVYVEVMGHRIIYHLENGQVEAYGTMKKVTGEIQNPSFALCNSCYYVNLRYVTAIEGHTLKLGKTELQISHPKKSIS